MLYLYFFSLVFAATPVAIASPRQPHAGWIKEYGRDSFISINNYADRTNFHSNCGNVWRLDAGTFASDGSLVTRLQHPRVVQENLFGSQQMFPMRIMVRTGYLSNAKAEEILNQTLQRDPRQIVFAQRSRMVEEGMAIDRFRNDLEFLVDEHVMASRFSKHGLLPLITATFYNVAGQVFNTDTGQVEPFDMPWELDPDREQLAKEFNPKPGDLFWEWGRAAQEVPGEANPLAAAIATNNYKQMRAFGGKFEQAYVMFHSFDDVNTIAYSKRFPDSLYPPGWQNLDDALFLVPLAKALKAFPPSQYSQKLAKMIEFSEGKLDDLSALDFLQDFQRLRFTLLDVTRPDGHRSPYPLALHDLSVGGRYRIDRLIEKAKLDSLSNSEKFLDLLRSQKPFFPTWNSGQYPDLADLEYSQHYYLQHKAIEISNLDAEAASQDFLYFRRTLIGVFCYYLKVLLDSKDFNFKPGGKTKFDQQAVVNFIHELRNNEIKFGLTTFDPQMAASIGALQPVATYTFQYETPEGFEVPELTGHEWVVKGHHHPPQAFLFTVDQILDWTNKYPAVFAQAMNSTFEDRWSTYLMLTDPEVF